MTDLTWLDATAQAELVRTGEASPKELVEAAIARIEAVNPQLDAVIRTRFDEARSAAAGELPDGPFKGVPILFKDLGCTVAG
jgi:amidase